jgi:hypothetical protein
LGKRVKGQLTMRVSRRYRMPLVTAAYDCTSFGRASLYQVRWRAGACLGNERGVCVVYVSESDGGCAMVMVRPCRGRRRRPFILPLSKGRMRL